MSENEIFSANEVKESLNKLEKDGKLKVKEVHFDAMEEVNAYTLDIKFQVSRGVMSGGVDSIVEKLKELFKD